MHAQLDTCIKKKKKKHAREKWNNLFLSLIKKRDMFGWRDGGSGEAHQRRDRNVTQWGSLTAGDFRWKTREPLRGGRDFIYSATWNTRRHNAAPNKSISQIVVWFLLFISICKWTPQGLLAHVPFIRRELMQIMTGWRTFFFFFFPPPTTAYVKISLGCTAPVRCRQEAWSNAESVEAGGASQKCFAGPIHSETRPVNLHIRYRPG